MNIMNRLLVVLLLSGAAMAGNSVTSAFEFLRTDFSPRSAAMAGASITMRGDINGIFINPAGMAFIDQRQFHLNYTNYLLDINGGSAGYSQVMPGLGVLSLGLVYMNYGTFDETDENAVETGNTFSANDLALAVSLADKLSDQFAYGLNLKYAFSQIQTYNASAVAIDFGLIYSAPFQKNLFFAVNVMNVGRSIEYYGDTKEPIPMGLAIGFSKILEHLPLEISANLNDLTAGVDKFSDRFKHFAVGGEFRLSDNLRLRLGYDNELRDNLQTTTEEKFAGLSGGLGIFWKNFRIDYSYSNFSFIGNVHRFGFTGTLN